MTGTLENVVWLALDVLFVPLVVALIVGVTFAFGWWLEGRRS